MGGRGGKSGLSAGGGYGGFGSLQNLINAANGVVTAGVNYDPNKRGGWDDDGNPAVVKYQNQDEDKLARYLAKVWNEVDLNDPQYADGYGYFENSFQKLVLATNLNKAPQVLSEADFDQYVQSTGAEVKYRGVSGKDAADRFFDATFNHVGNGIYGDGHYFSNNFKTAEDYGKRAARQKGNPPSSRVVVRMALSPKARVIDHATLKKAMQQAGVKLSTGLQKAGSAGSRSYAPNVGEAQFAMRLGYNVIQVSGGSNSYEYALTRDAFVVSKKRL